MKYYLNLDFKTGTLYSYSKESQEGYDKHTSSAGNVSYRKYFRKGVYGNLKTMYFKDTERGLQLRIILTQPGETEDSDGFYYMLMLPVMDQKGNIDRFVESLVSILPNIELDNPYRFFPYVLEKKLDSGKVIKQRGISVKLATLDNRGGGDAQAAVERAYTYQGKDDELTENMVPALEFKQIMGKWQPTQMSIAKRNEFLQEVLDREVNRLDKEPEEQDEHQGSAPSNDIQSEPPASAQAESKHAAQTAGVPDDDDDVPF